MTNISQNVNIEMLEKLPDGTYKRKYPKTRADDGTTFDEHLADDATIKHKAKTIGLESANFTSTNVESGMNELFTNVSDGKDLVGGAITGVDDSVVIPTDPTFQELANAIGGISTGKKWASGIMMNVNYYITVNGLDFTPEIVIIKNLYEDNSAVGNTRQMGAYVDTTISGLANNISFFTNSTSSVKTDPYNTVGLGTFSIRTSGGAEHAWIAFGK